mmetsp:Transcript_4567/g.9708  ORF Transcript_4567/g.9708 Transcript_4567/m.9708 type:complete len:221 (+) Transcript_4567:872-1534(+)
MPCVKISDPGDWVATSNGAAGRNCVRASLKEMSWAKLTSAGTQLWCGTNLNVFVGQGIASERIPSKSVLPNKCLEAIAAIIARIAVRTSNVPHICRFERPPLTRLEFFLRRRLSFSLLDLSLREEDLLPLLFALLFLLVLIDLLFLLFVLLLRRSRDTGLLPLCTDEERRGLEPDPSLRPFWRPSTLLSLRWAVAALPRLTSSPRLPRCGLGEAATFAEC